MNFLLERRNKNVFPEKITQKIFAGNPTSHFRSFLRLTQLLKLLQWLLSDDDVINYSSHLTIATVVHRFEEVINGNEYIIEVHLVDSNKWRAYLIRIPSGPTALMPFYGSTPVEAAQQLRNWLALAHSTPSNPV